MIRTLPNGNDLPDDEDGNFFLTGTKVEVSLDELVTLDLDGLLDLLSRRATGSPLLMDSNYDLNRVVDKSTVELLVSGDAANCFGGEV
jgi:hypothetical protein